MAERFSTPATDIIKAYRDSQEVIKMVALGVHKYLKQINEIALSVSRFVNSHREEILALIQLAEDISKSKEDIDKIEEGVETIQDLYSYEKFITEEQLTELILEETGEDSNFSEVDIKETIQVLFKSASVKMEKWVSENPVKYDILKFLIMVISAYFVDEFFDEK